METKTATGLKLDAGRVKKGTIVSRTSYMVVTEKSYGKVEVKNEEGFKWDLGEGVLEKECFTPDQFNEIKELTRTELIQKFSEVGDTIFSVNYNKLPTADDFLALTREDNKIRSHADMARDFKKLKGEEQTIVGYMVKNENGFGRSLIMNLEAKFFSKDEKEKGYRQVDHRTLNWLIHKNVKYVVKK